MKICKNNCCLIIFNIQKEFLPSLQNGQQLLDNCCWLVDLANEFDIPVMIIEHDKLGEPMPSLMSSAANLKSFKLFSTSYFSCLNAKDIKEHLLSLGKQQILLAGSETHITIFQTALDLQSAHLLPYVIVDASDARSKIDHDLAIYRLHESKVGCVTKEMLFFELLRRSDSDNYMNLSLKYLDRRYIRG